MMDVLSFIKMTVKQLVQTGLFTKEQTKCKNQPDIGVPRKLASSAPLFLGHGGTSHEPRSADAALKVPFTNIPV